ECLLVSRELGGWSVAHGQIVLGRVRYALGDRGSARTLFLAALDGMRAFGDRNGVSNTLVHLACLDMDEGDLAAVAVRLREALSLVLDNDLHISLGDVLGAYADLLVALGDPLFAARLWGRAERVNEEIRLLRNAFERQRFERSLAVA